MFLLSQDIAEAQSELQIPDSAFQRVPEPEAEGIVQKVKSRFLRDPQEATRWWWDSDFRLPALAAYFNGPTVPLLSHVVPSEDQLVWFITNVDDVSGQEPILVYASAPLAIQRILGECHGHHEYYVVARDLTWLICENHHGLILALGSSAIGQVRRYAALHPEKVRQLYDLDQGSIE